MLGLGGSLEVEAGYSNSVLLELKASVNVRQIRVNVGKYLRGLSDRMRASEDTTHCNLMPLI